MHERVERRVCDIVYALSLVHVFLFVCVWLHMYFSYVCVFVLCIYESNFCSLFLVNEYACVNVWTCD